MRRTLLNIQNAGFDKHHMVDIIVKETRNYGSSIDVKWTLHLNIIESMLGYEWRRKFSELKVSKGIDFGRVNGQNMALW